MWYATSGSVSPSGLYTAPPSAGYGTVKATDTSTGLYGTAAVTDVPAPPSGASISVTSPVTTTTASVTGSATGSGTLTYTWSEPTGRVTFLPNGTGVAANTTATFTSAGPYTINLTVTDAYDQSTSATAAVTVTQTATTINVKPNPTWSEPGGRQTFKATECDQFGNALALQPTFNWTAVTGGVSSAGLYTAPSAAGTDTVTATDSVLTGVSGFSNVTIAVQVPITGVTITVNTPQPITGSTASLTGTGTGTGALTYAWSEPSGNVQFSPNGTNASANTTATFSAAGTYTITLTVTDITGASASATASVTVTQTATDVWVSPNSAYVTPGGTQLFSAVEEDQCGNPMATQPAFTWIDVSGTIDVNGNYTAPATAGSDTVTAADLVLTTVKGTANVTIAVPVAPTAVTITVNTPQPITGTIASLSGSATGAAPLTYSWTDASGSVDFSPNYTSDASSTTAMIGAAGTYTIILTVTDGTGGSATATTTMTVNSVPSSVEVFPAYPDVSVNGTLQFSGTILDQFGLPITPASSIAWSVPTGTGTIDPAGGLYTAPGGAETDTILATAAGVLGSTTVQVLATPSANATPAPTGLTATAGVQQVTLSWNAVTGATSYSVYSGPTVGGEDMLCPIADGVAGTSSSHVRGARRSRLFRGHRNERERGERAK